MFFNRLLTATRIWWSTVFKMIKLKFVFNSIHIFFISFLSLRFSKCLFSSSVFIMNNEIFHLSLCVAFFIEIFIFANVSIKRSFQQVLIFYVSNYLPVFSLQFFWWSYYCNHILPMLLLDTFENVILGIKFYDKKNFEKLEQTRQAVTSIETCPNTKLSTRWLR